MDEALKRGESLQSKDTESCKTADTSKYTEHSSAENSEAAVSDWNSYYYGAAAGYDYYENSQAWDYSQQYQTDESYSTKDPFREPAAASNETSSEEAPTS